MNTSEMKVRYAPSHWDEKKVRDALRERPRRCSSESDDCFSPEGRALEAEERPRTIYPLAILVAVILIIVGVVETMWLVQTLSSLWYLPSAEVVPQLPEITWSLAMQAPAVFALPIGAWLLAAPTTGRHAACALLAIGIGMSMASYDPAMQDGLLLAVQCTMLAAVIAFLWIERAAIGR